MNLKVSIIVPCYNQAKYLKDALSSVKEQTNEFWECIIVNDGSSDNIKEVVETWIKTDNRFRYYEIKNSGVSNARNFGIKKSEGRYILPLDADDYLSNNYVEACLNIIENSPIKVVYGKADFFGNKTGSLFLREPSLENLLKFNCIHCSGMYRKKDWELIEGYDSNMKFGFEDWEFWINMLQHGGAILTEDCVLNYRIKSVSRSTKIDSNNGQNIEMRDYIFKKHIKLYGYNSVYDVFKEKEELKIKVENIKKAFTWREILTVVCYKIMRVFKRVLK